MYYFVSMLQPSWNAKLTLNLPVLASLNTTFLIYRWRTKFCAKSFVGVLFWKNKGHVTFLKDSYFLRVIFFLSISTNSILQIKFWSRDFS